MAAPNGAGKALIVMSLRIEPRLLLDVKRAARRNGENVSEHIRRLMRENIEREKAAA